jgi:hypothetical protein
MPKAFQDAASLSPCRHLSEGPVDPLSIIPLARRDDVRLHLSLHQTQLGLAAPNRLPGTRLHDRPRDPWDKKYPVGIAESLTAQNKRES